MTNPSDPSAQISADTKPATVTLDGFLHFDEMRARHPDIWPSPFVWREHEPQADGSSVLVRAQQITIEVPEDFDPRAGMVAAIEKKIRQADAEHAAKVTAWRRQINQLTAIECSGVAQ